MILNFKTYLVGWVTLFCLGSLEATQCSDPKTFRFAVIPKKSVEIQLNEYRPLIQVLGRLLARRIELVHPVSYGAVVEGILSGSIDLAELGPASYALAKTRDSGITAFASIAAIKGTYTDSPSHYRSLLIVRRDKGFNSMADLRGASVSLIDPTSTSGALLPREAVAKLTGVSLEHFFGRVTFAGSHDRAIQSVQKGIIDAAFVSSLRVDEALNQGRLGQNELKIVWTSSPIPHDPFVYRGKLCPNLVALLDKAFFQNGASFRDMFLQLNISKFTRVNDDNYQEIRAIFANQH